MTENKVLFDATRKELKELPVWTTDGKILTKLDDGRVVRIKSKEDILKL